MPKFLGNGKKRREEGRAEEQCRQPLSEFAFRFPYSEELERGQLTTKDGEGCNRLQDWIFRSWFEYEKQIASADSGPLF